MRKLVTLPKRLPHSFCPAASETYALGVVRWFSQYVSSWSRMRLWSNGNGASQSAIDAWSVMPFTSGVRSGSLAGVGRWS